MHSCLACVPEPVPTGSDSSSWNQRHLPPCSLSSVPLVPTFSSGSYYVELICPPRLLFPVPGIWAASSVRAGPHYSPLSSSFGLKAAVFCPLFPSPRLLVMLWAQALSPWSTKLLWMCGAIHLQHVVPNHLVPTSVRAERCAPTIRT